MPAKKNGFTLVELVIGIIVFSIAMTFFVSFIVPQAVRSVDPIFQVRAAELGQSLMTEITSKSFDENSDRVGGNILCGATGASACTAHDQLLPEESSRDNYDDVDDYNGLNESGVNIENALGQTNSLYAEFNLSVRVVYDDNMDGTEDLAVGNTKLITVIVTTPNNEQITFSTFRSNF